jgi:hypothetical protein
MSHPPPFVYPILAVGIFAIAVACTALRRQATRRSGAMGVFSRFGASLVGGYAILTSLILWDVDIDGGSDPKGNYVLLQLPLSPILEVLRVLELHQLTDDWPWRLAYAVLFPLQLAALYALGAGLSWGMRTIVRGNGPDRKPPRGTHETHCRVPAARDDQAS